MKVAITQVVDVGLFESFAKAKQLSAFRIYLALRTRTLRNGGYFDSTAENRLDIASDLRISVSTFDRHFRKCKELQLILPCQWNARKWNVVSMQKLRVHHRIRGKRVVEVRTRDLRGSASCFSAFTAAALTTEFMDRRRAQNARVEKWKADPKQYAKYQRYLNRQSKCESKLLVTDVICKPTDKILCGHISNGTLAKYLNVSKASASRLSRKAESLGLLKLRTRYHDQYRAPKKPGVGWWEVLPKEFDHLDDWDLVKYRGRVKVVNGEWRVQMTNHIQSNIPIRQRKRTFDISTAIKLGYDLTVLYPKKDRSEVNNKNHVIERQWK